MVPFGDHPIFLRGRFRIERLEKFGDTLNVKKLYDSLEIKSAYLITIKSSL